MVKLLVEIVGVSVAVAGVALISVPAALIAGGLAVVVAVEAHS
jgi:hypothetical protein